MPKLPQSVALHIGAHKTASTHLQKVLDENKAILSEGGIRFYGPSELRSNNRELQARFDLSWSKAPPSGRTAHDQLARLAQGHKRVVFSEENVAGMLTDREGRMRFPIYPDAFKKVEELIACWAPLKPQIFIAVRNPATFMTSAYGQGLYSAPHVGPRTFRDRNDWRKVDWAGYVARISAIAGVGEVFVWRQEDYAENPRPVYRRLLRWRTGGQVKTIEHRVHQGLSAAAVRSTLQRAVDGETGGIAGHARHAFPVNEQNKPFKLYAASTYVAAEKIYADQMARISAMDGVTVLYQESAATGDVEKG